MIKQCIMKIDDYISKADVERLTAKQWQQFREYLRNHGHRASDQHGQYYGLYGPSECTGVVLDTDGDLSWWDELPEEGTQVTYEQIVAVVGDSQQSAPPHVQARNQRINEIKQLIELHEELITRLHNTDTIGLKASIDHYQQQIKDLSKSLDEAKQRCSGRTTNIALKTIAQAMQYPNQNILIKDHHDTIESHRHLANMIESMLTKLQLTGFVIDRSKLTLHYQGL